MGACCSHDYTSGRFEGCPNDEKDDQERDTEDIILRGDDGARIQLQGSSKYISMFTKRGKKRINQDEMTVWENFSGDKEMLFCGVFDGHGPSGHKVAHFVRDFLPTEISSSYKQSDAVLDIETQTGEEGGENPESRNPLFLSWKARLTKCFNEVDEQLKGEASIDSYSSGTTSVCVLKKGEHLIIANLGDSRAVLCTRDDNNRLISEQITVDLKPNLPGERQRIRSCNGRVLAMERDHDVYRVWMPNEDCPGLAMARAFGDFCLKDFGLISTPVVTYRKLDERDQFVVLATDGIWDVLSNDEVVKIVASAGRKRSRAARLVVGRAVRAWKYKFPRAKVDDCAAICLFFKQHGPGSLSEEVAPVEINDNDDDDDDDASCSHVGSVGSDDALETVLNCDVNEIPDDSQRLRKRSATKSEHVGE